MTGRVTDDVVCCGLIHRGHMVLDRSGKVSLPKDVIIKGNLMLEGNLVELRRQRNVPGGALYQWQSHSGASNNVTHPKWGKSNQQLLRKSSTAYEDGVSALANRPKTAREISNAVCAQSTSRPSVAGLTDMTWVWGQFVDHELDLTPADSDEHANIMTSGDDPNEAFPGRTIAFRRSGFVEGTSPRQFPNRLSSFLDATNVYGNDNDRAQALRMFDGTGRLRTSTANNGEVLGPRNTSGLDNETHGGDPEDFYLFGDVRGNENVALAGMHTLWVREHNRLCTELAAKFPKWVGQDEILYQHARRLVIAMQQRITYAEFLPALLGASAIPAWKKYNDSTNPSVATEFSTVGFRVGHTMLSSNIQIGDDSGNVLALRDAFFNPSWLQTNGIDGVLLGVTKREQQEIDGKVVDDVRNFLFGAPTGNAMLDLAALNIQRGRDHGIADYATLRVSYGLGAPSSFADITSNVTVANTLQTLYGSPGNVDPWIGGIVEDHLPGSQLGPLFRAIVRDQFLRTRDGDRFWYENNPALTADEVTEVNSTKLSDVLRRNCNVAAELIADDVFHIA